MAERAVLDPHFDELAGRRALGIARPRDYTDWAEALLVAGLETESVAVLAGLGLDREPESAEVETFFQRSLSELDLELPAEALALQHYAVQLCRRLVAGEVDAIATLYLLESFYVRSDYDPLYSVWDELTEDLAWLDGDEPAYFNPGLTRETLPARIGAIARQFLVLLDTDLPPDFFRMSLCGTCGFFGESGVERSEMNWLPEAVFRYLFRRGPARRAVCARCGAGDPRPMSDFEARETYLRIVVPSGPGEARGPAGAPR